MLKAFLELCSWVFFKVNEIQFLLYNMPEEESKVQVIIKDDIETGKVSCGHKICALKRIWKRLSERA